MHWNPAVGIPLLIIGLIVLGLIWLFGQPRKPGQGRRQPVPPSGSRGERREPTFGVDAQEEDGLDADDAMPDEDLRTTQVEPFQASLLETQKSEPEADVEEIELPPIEPAQRTAPAPPAPAHDPHRSTLGQRPADLPVERIVAVNVVAPGNAVFQGADLVVAADKAGLDFGHKGIFHRLLEGKPELGPIFSVANMLQPGSFDLSRVVDLTTTGLSFFMTLPGPVSALDAWDAMLPTAQRMAELLGGQVLDDEHNALGRQRIAHIRDELRAWDRKHQGDEIGFGP
ncbi:MULTISPECIES: cell division protein ZipA [Oleiagrimonas]|uniref:Cell division protein ZipA n=1 Tax=Oleiagrimonas citrea TaxID=1665687 RepID=A0A846ZJ82_9GAMM|nr:MULTISPECIES: cell division protein ZipA [Oleiagrimonas]NKZ37431.1 cell division protein ZipA [Oleiagrimonas citrea]RAP57933.1 cell division protein ZipA [Oleiagrimonas sp. MCCC 1A03011]